MPKEVEASGVVEDLVVTYHQINDKILIIS